MSTLSKARWHMLILHEHDIDAAVKLYETLGFTLQFNLKDQWAELILDGIRLGLAHSSQELPDRRTGIVLEVDDIVAACNAIKELGCTVVNEPVDAPHGMIASFKDPGNTIVDLFQPMPEKYEALLKEKFGDNPDGCCAGGNEERCC